MLSLYNVDVADAKVCSHYIMLMMLTPKCAVNVLFLCLQAMAEADAVRLLTLNLGHKPYISAMQSKVCCETVQVEPRSACCETGHAEPRSACCETVHAEPWSACCETVHVDP